MCSVKGLLTYVYTKTHVWKPSEERGLKWCMHVYPKLDDALRMLCWCEGILYMIVVDALSYMTYEFSIWVDESPKPMFYKEKKWRFSMKELIFEPSKLEY